LPPRPLVPSRTTCPCGAPSFPPASRLPRLVAVVVPRVSVACSSVAQRSRPSVNWISFSATDGNRYPTRGHRTELPFLRYFFLRCFGIGNCNVFLRAGRTSRERERRLESSRAHTPARHVLTTRHPRGESLVSSVHPGSPPAALRARPRGLLFRATTSPPVSREWRPGSRHRQASREQRVLPTALRVLPRVPAGYVAFRPCFFPDCQRLSNR